MSGLDLHMSVITFTVYCSVCEGLSFIQEYNEIQFLENYGPNALPAASGPCKSLKLGSLYRRV